jgi:acyl-coenzyme A synthetase/AMP-(fatty) acid ligase
MGEEGELAIRGAGVSRGYWNNGEKTEEQFIPNPFTNLPGDRIYRTGDRAVLRDDGNLEFLGRKDDQVKLMGYRIDLGEIEHAILSMKEVKESAAVLVPSEEGGRNRIVAFAVTEDGGLPPRLLQTLAHQLPYYMMPQRVLAIKEMPRTERGKVDRRTLLGLLKESTSPAGADFPAPPSMGPSVETT